MQQLKYQYASYFDRARAELEEIFSALWQLSKPGSKGYTLFGTRRNGFKATASMFTGEVQVRTGQTRQQWLRGQMHAWRRKLDQCLTRLQQRGTNITDLEDILAQLNVRLSVSATLRNLKGESRDANQ
jgi:hypothetical protein